MAAEALRSALRIEEILDVMPGFMCIGFDPERQQPRFSDCFVYVISGLVEYHFPDRCVTTCEGSVMYIPRGTTYFMRVKQPYTHIFVNFNFMQLGGGRPAGVSVSNVLSLENTFRSMLKSWTSDSEGAQLRCLGLMYLVCATLLEQQHNRYIPLENRTLVQRAVQLMDEHIGDQHYGVSEIAAALNISEGHLRRLFRASLNSAPVRFYQQRRVMAAKLLLTETNLSIPQIAERVGFCNAYYFSRIFTQLIGVPPGKYRKDMIT